MNIVLTGSLGNISKPLATALIAEGHSVTVISSKADKQKEIESIGAKATIGSLEDINFLTAAFAGADAVYCMIPFNFMEEDQAAYFKRIETNYVQAIRQNGIEKVVFLTGWAADTSDSLLLNQLSDRTVTELRPGFFYTNFYNDIQTIKEHGALMSGYGGDDKIAFVSPNDIAGVAFEELTAPFQGKKVRYVASEELSCDEAAKILGEAIGKPDLKWIALPEEQLLNGLIQSGFPQQLAHDFVRMQAETHSGKTFENYLKNRPELGKTKLKAFAEEFAKAYNEQ
ncbi:NAD(P)H-binding protein [Chryseobacterium sp. WG14]|uniref:NmrA family NAD(P)-binding protein n=1 Tax=unclassified Chryseobacterium TaxID=2593645 RepID=UPI00211E2349|nr:MULTISPECIES: NAD(P)H-binding protein [unclassified Chryseobacterium]MCQ9634229.1 NAD(P)H-binding protein [Chryseobacterium sp. WG23]MCQ9638104.1 NAD(P)H-binding protein [Chryseobacterium sp. WG14]